MGMFTCVIRRLFYLSLDRTPRMWKLFSPDFSHTKSCEHRREDQADRPVENPQLTKSFVAKPPWGGGGERI